MNTRLGNKIVDGDGKIEFITKEEKAKTQEMFMRRLEQIMGGKSCDEFAHEVGLSRNNVYSYVHGYRFPTAHALKRIAERCGCTVDWLVGHGE